MTMETPDSTIGPDASGAADSKLGSTKSLAGKHLISKEDSHSTNGYERSH